MSNFDMFNEEINEEGKVAEKEGIEKYNIEVDIDEDDGEDLITKLSKQPKESGIKRAGEVDLSELGISEDELEEQVASYYSESDEDEEDDYVISMLADDESDLDDENQDEESVTSILKEDEKQDENGVKTVGEKPKLEEIIEKRQEGLNTGVKKVSEAIEEGKIISELISESGDLEEEPDRELSDEEKYESLKKSEPIREAIKEEMGSEKGISDEVTFGLKNKEGKIISPRSQGGIHVRMLAIDEIVTPPRARLSESSVIQLTEQIRQFGLLQPIHVVPYKGQYALLNGYRRLQAMRDLGFDDIPAIVDETIPAELIKYYETIVNGTQQYTFSEMIDYGQKFVAEQGTLIGYDTIESILGLGQGEFLKGLYIDSMKGDYFEIYQQVEKGKLNIEQGFKKIEKEIAKAEKEMNGVDALNSGELDEQLRNKDELNELNNDAGTQELGDRKILDPVIRRSVESRDGGYCQCCGYGKDQPDLMGVFNVHHMVAVQYGGSDNKSNLILLCSNCHKLAHDYEAGRFLPDKEFYDNNNFVKKIVVVGNILQIMKAKAIHVLKTKHESVYRQVNAKKTTVGKAIKQLGIDLHGEEYFNGSPYEMFKEQADNINVGKHEISELTTLSYGDEEEAPSSLEVEGENGVVYEESTNEDVVKAVEETIGITEDDVNDEYATLLKGVEEEDELAIDKLDED